MSSNTPTTPKSSESKNNSPSDPSAEFEKLKLEPEEIDNKIKKEGSPLLNPTENSSIVMLNKLEEMMKEIREMKEDVSAIKSEQQHQKKLQEDLTRNQQNQKQILNELKESVSSIVKGLKKEPVVNCETDIRSQINGKWKDVNTEGRCFSAKFEGDTFVFKWNELDNIRTIGVEDADGFTASVEKDKFVQSRVTEEGAESWRHEFYIKNKQLKYKEFRYGQELNEVTLERFEDPDPQ